MSSIAFGIITGVGMLVSLAISEIYYQRGNKLAKQQMAESYLKQDEYEARSNKKMEEARLENDEDYERMRRQGLTDQRRSSSPRTQSSDRGIRGRKA